MVDIDLATDTLRQLASRLYALHKKIAQVYSELPGASNLKISPYSL